MRQLVRRAAVLAVALLAACAIASGATAAKPQTVTLTGTWVGSDPTLLELRFTGPNVHVEFDAIATYSGDIVGTSTNPTHALLKPDGTIVGHTTETITGTFAGFGGGTLVLNEQFRNGPDGDRGWGVVVSATGALAGVHGSVTFSAGTYEIVLSR